MATPSLDPTSRRILQLLAADGRVSYQAIADEVGLSRPAVMERVKRLEETGYIEGYTVRLNRAKVGSPITSFVAVRYSASDHTDTESSIATLADNPHILECHHVAGDDCFILKVTTPSLERLEDVLREVRALGRSVSTRTTIALSTVFEKPGFVPVEPD